MAQDEYFGKDDQRAVLRRGKALAELLRDDPRFSYYGRTVGLVTPEDGSVDELAALARVQGNSNYSAVPVADVPALVSALEKRGLIPLHYARWEGTDTPLTAAREVVDTLAMPQDITVHRMDASTSEAHMDSFAQMALGCGVLPLSGAAMRGLLHPSVCLYACDAAGAVVSCAAASAFAHTAHGGFGDQAWWGMLATDPSRRGERLALILGAQVLIEMASEYGYRRFMTGVEPGNAPSEAVCTRMGLAPGDYAIIGCADPQSLASGRMTK